MSRIETMYLEKSKRLIIWNSVRLMVSATVADADLL